MTIVLLSLIVASLLWATTTFLDKHLIANVSENNDYKGLYIFSTFVSAIIFLPIYLLLSKFNLAIDLRSLVTIFLLACCEVGYLIFYMKAMAKDDTSVVNILFQFVPVITYFLGLLFLHENYTPIQIVSGVAIILSTVAMSIKREKNNKFNKDKLMALLFMLISSFILSLQNLGFKISILETNFNATMFYFQLFLLIIGASSLLLKPFRTSFASLVKNNGKKVFVFNITNEVFNSAAKALKTYAFGLAPIAFVSVFQNSTQIIIAFLMGIALTIFRPKYFKEDISKKTIIKKTICITIAIVATIFFI